MSNNKAKTYSYQSSLKPLPIADLSSSAIKYLKSIKPILTDEEYNKTQAVVADFVKPGGEAEKLYAHLSKYAKQQEQKGKSWMEDWWLEYGYLRGRYPLPINLSCHLLVDDEFTAPASYSQTQQAARYIMGLYDWKTQLDNENIPPELAKGKPLCMNQYTTLFTTERQPGHEIDVVKTVPPTDKVVVLVKNQFFLLDLKHPDGKLLSLSELELQITRIKEESSKNRVESGVGELTTLPRDEWATIREEMYRDPTNKKIFDEIERAVFVISLDSKSPRNADDFAFETATGTRDRWYDKIVNFIFFENSKVSVLLEHTPCDAPTIGMWVRNHFVSVT
eukprot:TRINITY_DN4724_c0_g1_i1.p1 TRINITY_DN4724_c0_g1~~TRINITY_DN4724_c0_g1_i1.p1  ORF type:complete len:335 (-),score=73.43 TRINITY_DN4724_c0_g1_i1:1093-2097(-)